MGKQNGNDGDTNVLQSMDDSHGLFFTSQPGVLFILSQHAVRENVFSFDTRLVHPCMNG